MKERLAGSESVLLAEFNALRAEVLVRVQIRSQLLALAITSFATIFALSAGSTFPKETLFLYPILAFLISMEWTYHDLRLFQIATYIKQELEVRLPDLGWQHSLDEKRALRTVRISILAPLGVFSIASIIALVAAFAELDVITHKYGLSAYGFVVLDVLALMGSLWAIFLRRVDTRGYKNKISPL